MVSILRFRAGVCYTLHDPSLIHHVYNQLGLGTEHTRKEESPRQRQTFPGDPNKDRARNLPVGLQAILSSQPQEIPG